MKILLVEPNYYTQYPPLGLLKLSSLYKAQGHEIRFIRGLSLVARFVPDEIKVTSLFTWAWKPVWEAIAFYRALFPKAKISLGGVYASLTPEHAKGSGADEVFTGLVNEAEDLMPDYSIVPEWHQNQAASILFSSRGCIRSCGFCAVPKLEGKPFKIRPSTRIKHLVHPEHNRVIPDLPECSVDSVVTDPPYELGFMGKSWDRSGIAYNVEVWREVLRVLKPGGHLLAFGGSRTYHRLACAIEDAGLEIRDTITWLFGSGFPKSLNISKAIDAAAGRGSECGWGLAMGDGSWGPPSKRIRIQGRQRSDGHCSLL